MSVSLQQVVILGSTGSIGVNTLDVIAQYPERFAVFALTANTSVKTLHQQCLQFKPRFAVMVSESSANELRRLLQATPLKTEVLSGPSALVEVVRAAEVTTVMAAIVGAAGLQASIAAASAGKKVLLANKEALVMAGSLFMEAVRRHGATLLPIDSEHNAIFQCLPSPEKGLQTGYLTRGVKRILLTASGGPFRTLPLSVLSQVTPEQACAHPNWRMGRKISVDSATMMNKGLELIEASWLFDVSHAEVDVVIHPQSVIHSMVEYVDGSVLAQLGNPDMRTPIAYGLAWPERMASGVPMLDLIAQAHLDFLAVDDQRFPALRLAREAAKVGGMAPAILNAANEIAVEAFLQGALAFTDIAVVVEAVLNTVMIESSIKSLEQIEEADHQARGVARALIQKSALTKQQTR